MNIYINYMLKFLLKCISKINIFTCILLNSTYLLNYCVKKVNIHINDLLYFVLKYVCKKNIFCWCTSKHPIPIKLLCKKSQCFIIYLVYFVLKCISKIFLNATYLLYYDGKKVNVSLIT